MREILSIFSHSAERLVSLLEAPWWIVVVAVAVYCGIALLCYRWFLERVTVSHDTSDIRKKKREASFVLYTGLSVVVALISLGSLYIFAIVLIQLVLSSTRLIMLVILLSVGFITPPLFQSMFFRRISTAFLILNFLWSVLVLSTISYALWRIDPPAATPTVISSQVENIKRIVGRKDNHRPFSMRFVPHYNQYLVTERYNSSMAVYENDTFKIRRDLRIESRDILPDVRTSGHFGWGDIVFDPAFDGRTNRIVYISVGLASLSDHDSEGIPLGTHAIIKTKYDPKRYTINNGDIIPQSAIIFESTRDPSRIGRNSERSPGLAMQFLPDHTLLFSIGYVHQRLVSQDLWLFGGKTIRLMSNGDPVCNIKGKVDNPFCESDNSITRYIYTYGHKNIQGITVDSDGVIYAIEHGERGGDEINILRPGHNYGYPHVMNGGLTYGKKAWDPKEVYPLSPLQDYSDFTDPAFVWNNTADSVAPGGIHFYHHDNAFGKSLLVAALAQRRLYRFDISSDESIRFGEVVAVGRRFRAVRSNEIGEIYLVEDFYAGIKGSIWKITVQ